MAGRNASLVSRHPWRLDVPLVLLAGIGLLALGLTLPLVETRTLFFWRNEFSILGNLRALWRNGERGGAVIVLLASVIYPTLKAAVLLWLLVMPFPARWRKHSLGLLRWLGRWAFVDVMVVSAIVTASLVIGPMKATPKFGLYCYAGAVFGLTIATFQMDRLARRAAGR